MLLLLLSDQLLDHAVLVGRRRWFGRRRRRAFLIGTPIVLVVVLQCESKATANIRVNVPDGGKSAREKKLLEKLSNCKQNLREHTNRVETAANQNGHVALGLRKEIFRLLFARDVFSIDLQHTDSH